MAFVFNNNYFPPTGSAAIFAYKQLLKSIGWIVKASSDGSYSFSNTSDIIDHPGTGVGGMGNQYAYFLIQQPTGGRQLCFQQAFDQSWRICYSVLGMDTFPSNPIFTPTLPTSSVGDDSFIFGDNTSQGFYRFPGLFQVNATYKMQIAADSNPPYGTYFFTYYDEKRLPISGFVFDPLASNSYDLSDQDPTMLYATGITDNQFGTDISTMNVINNPKGWYRKGDADEQFVPFVGLTLGHYDIANYPNVAVPGNIGSNPYTNMDQLFPLVYARPAINPPVPPTGYKGISSMMQWTGSTRGTISIVSVASPGDHIVVNRVALPWNNSTLVI